MTHTVGPPLHVSKHVIINKITLDIKHRKLAFVASNEEERKIRRGEGRNLQGEMKQGRACWFGV